MNQAESTGIAVSLFEIFPLCRKLIFSSLDMKDLNLTKSQLSNLALRCPGCPNISVRQKNRRLGQWLPWQRKVLWSGTWMRKIGNVSTFGYPKRAHV